MTQLLCCYSQEDDSRCPNLAEFEVRDLGDDDPYCSDTHACQQHVGGLIGHRVDLKPTRDEWSITWIKPELKESTTE